MIPLVRSMVRGWRGMVLSALLVVSAIPGGAARMSTDTENPIVARLQELLRTGDSFAAAEHLEREGDARTVGKRYFGVMNALYWKKHDLPAVVTVARPGIHYCLSRARDAGEAEAADLRGIAKSMAYDLASFTWIGWDEPGIRITAADEAAGLDAARLNLRLAVELKRGPEPMMNAHWVLGAQQLAHGQFQEATASFERAAEFARQDKNRGGELMCQGYGILSRLLSGTDPGGEQALQANGEALVKEKDGDFFRDQIATARRVLTARFKR